MSILSKIFTWWNGTTIGTTLFTARHGERVGEDERGNVYYRNSDGSRRWVIYADETEASNVSGDWYGWMHHTFDEPPTEKAPQNWSWQKDRLPNLTGTDAAYRPPGSLATLDGATPAVEKPYTPWVPE